MIDINFSPEEEEKVILHVLVVGFHHKKGSQVDYCYPPLVDTCYCSSQVTSSAADGVESGSGTLEGHKDGEADDGDQLLPEEWKAVPSLSLPDGAHNFSSDSVFFHLPMVSKCPLHGQIHPTKYSNDQPGHRNHQSTENKIVYGISCYRQVVASDSIKESDSSITRTTVMKAVVVLSRLPFYGLISAKVDSITRVYFGQKNFSDKSCLIELYNNLNYVLSKNQREILSPTEARLLALSPTKYLLIPFGHRVLVLLKLLLLEKKILFFSSAPLVQSSVSGKRSPLVRSPLVGGRKAIKTPTTPTAGKMAENDAVKESDSRCVSKGDSDVPKDKSMATSIKPEDLIESSPSSSPASVRSLCLSLLTLSSLIPEVLEPDGKQYHLYCGHCQEVDPVPNSSNVPSSNVPSSNVPSSNVSSDCQSVGGQSPVIAVTEGSGSFPDATDSNRSHSNDSQTLAKESPSSARAHSRSSQALPPFQLFDYNHAHLHPYLDLSFIDAVSNFESCLIGATNGLYKQKKTSLFDVTVDVVTGM